MVDNSANLNQRVLINGVEYELKGKVDFSDLTITKTGTVPPTEPPVDPGNPPTEPPTDPGTGTEVDPNTGTRKEGTKWSKNPGDPSTWKVIEMTDADKAGLYKIVDKDGLNIIADIPSKDTAYKLVEYFKTHPFPPVTTEPPTNPPTEPPAPGGSGTDKYGTKLLVSDGKEVIYEVKNNFRDDGKRFDVKVGEWAQSEATGYFRFTKDPVDDEVSIKWSEMSHSGSNNVQCYDSGVEIKTGKARLRFENPHPNYSNSLGSGQGAPLSTKFIGYKGTKTVSGDSVTIKLYQDTGDNEGDKPANQWKEIFSYTDNKYKRTGAHPYVTLRIDDPAKNGQKNLEAKWISVARIA